MISRRFFVSSGILAAILLTVGVIASGTATRSIADSPEVVNGQMQDGSEVRVELAESSFAAQLSQALSPRNMIEYSKLLSDPDVQPASPGPVIDFDKASAPCLFSETTALRGLHQAGWFLGYGKNGGGILNECSNFGVSAHSGQNFLAFNPSSTYSDGGVPRPPTAIIFDAPHTRVNVHVASGFDPGHLTALIALRSWTFVEDVEVFYTTESWTQYTLTGKNIRALWIVSQDPHWVIDTITFDGGEPDLLIECGYINPNCPAGSPVTHPIYTLVDFSSGTNTCTVEYIVGNHGTASAGASTTQVTVSGSGGPWSAFEPTPALAPGTSVTLTTTVTTGLSYGCPFEPDLWGTITVDNSSVVPESNEANNAEDFLVIG